MSIKEKDELECLILEYKDKAELAEANGQDSSFYKKHLAFLENKKAKGFGVPDWVTQAFNSIEKQKGLAFNK